MEKDPRYFFPLFLSISRWSRPWRRAFVILLPLSLPLYVSALIGWIICITIYVLAFIAMALIEHLWSGEEDR